MTAKDWIDGWSLGEVLIYLRKSRHLTQGELALKAKTTQREVSFIENGKRKITPKILQTLIAMLSSSEPLSENDGSMITRAIISDALSFYSIENGGPCLDQIHNLFKTLICLPERQVGQGRELHYTGESGDPDRGFHPGSPVPLRISGWEPVPDHLREGPDRCGRRGVYGCPDSLQGRGGLNGSF